MEKKRVKCSLLVIQEVNRVHRDRYHVEDDPEHFRRSIPKFFKTNIY